MDIVKINIDDLVVDHCNMRKGKIAVSEDFQESVNQVGVLEPLTVRPSHCSKFIPGGKYGIVCGAQRYRAAIMSSRDIEELPCIIREMDDYEARIASIQENYLRNPPEWHEYISDIRELYIAKGMENGVFDKHLVIYEIAQNLGIKEESARFYLRVSFLPKPVRILFKKQPSRREKQVLESYGISSSRVIGKGKARLLTILDSDLDFSQDELMEFIRRFLRKNTPIWEKAIELLQDDPELSLDEIEQELEGARDRKTVSTSVDLNLFANLQEICLQRNKTIPELLSIIIKEWIKRHTSPPTPTKKKIKLKRQKFGWSKRKRNGTVVYYNEKEETSN